MTEIQWGDERITSGGKKYDIVRPKKFKGRKDKIERIYLIEEKASAAWTHFLTIGYFKCLAERSRTADSVHVDKKTCPVCTRLPELMKEDQKKWKSAIDKLRIGTNVIYYNTNKEGDVLDPYVVETRLWTIDPVKFAMLGDIKKEWGPLQGYDLKIATVDENFQKLSIINTRSAACKESGRWEATLAEYNKNKYDVPRDLCRVLNRAELVDVMAEFETNTNASPANLAPSQPRPVVAHAASSAPTAVAVNSAPSMAPANGTKKTQSIDLLLNDI